ncbi:hypothetical protein AQI70_16515 [Streptomyces curacoi]|uniref:Uncharacterized protein n=1 Tax=Streptomyces curacoi TaxID=146536 RepID=A0A117P970_9ACTN|nr:hypothetical protein AQI70_16515 [Streptomyces curacoi]
MRVERPQRLVDLVLRHLRMQRGMSHQDEGTGTPGLDTEVGTEPFSALVQPGEIVDGLADGLVHLRRRHPGIAMPLDERTPEAHGAFEFDDMERPVAAYQRNVDLVPGHEPSLRRLAHEPPAEDPVLAVQRPLHVRLCRLAILDDRTQLLEPGGTPAQFGGLQQEPPLIVGGQQRQGFGRGDDLPGFGRRVRDIDPAVTDDPLQPQRDLGPTSRNDTASWAVFGGLEEQRVLTLRPEVLQELLDPGLGVGRQEFPTGVEQPLVHRLHRAAEEARVRLPPLPVPEQPVPVLEVVPQDASLRVLDRILHEPYDLPLADSHRGTPRLLQEP